MNYLLFIFLFLISCTQVYASEVSRDILVSSLTDEWQVYHEQKSIYVPFLPSLHQAEHKVHLIFNPAPHADLFLTVETKANTSIFINSAFAYHVSSNQWFSIPVKEITKHQKAKEEVLITFYLHSKGSFQYKPKAFLTKTKYSSFIIDASQVDKKEKIYAQKRFYPPSKDRIIMLAMVTIIFIALLSFSPQPLFSQEIVRYIASNYFKTTKIIQRHTAIPTLLYFVYYGFVFAFVVMLFGSYSSYFSYQDLFGMGHDASVFFKSWILALLFSWVFLSLRYLLIWVSAQLHNIGHQQYLIHIQMFMNTGFIYTSGVLMLSFLLSFIAHEIPSWGVDASFVLISVLLILQACVMSYYINQAISLKKLYLFSYLCSTEIIPVLLIVKFFLAS